MRNLSGLKRKVKRLERCERFLDRAPDFDAYHAITMLALVRSSQEDFRSRERFFIANERDPTREISADEKAVMDSVNSRYGIMLQEECQRCEITVEQWSARLGLTKPMVLRLKRQYIERHWYKPNYEDRPKKKIPRCF